MESIGERIHKLRKKRGLTLQVLGQLTYTSPTFLCDIEQSRAAPSISRLIELADVLETSASYLLGETPNPLPISAEQDKITAILSKAENKVLMDCLKELTSLSNTQQREVLNYIRYLSSRNIDSSSTS